MTITDRFSQAPLNYHLHAQMQKQVAKELFDLVDFQFPKSTILEIGCGTGNLTKYLLKAYPECHFLISDIAPGMVDFCKNRLQYSNLSIDFKVLDGEQPISINPSMIASGMTLQWFSSPLDTLQHYLDSLIAGGFLLISFPNDKSFPEWKHCALQADVPFTAHPLPSHEQFVFQMRNNHSKIIEKRFCTSYSSILSFFLELKTIGANFNHSGQLNCSQLKRLIKFWNKLEYEYITYSITMGVIQKR